MMEADPPTIHWQSSGTEVPPPGLDITLAQLYELSDHLAASYSDEQIIAAAKATWTSWVYGHYILGVQRVYTPDPTTGSMVLDHILFTFTCKFDPGRCKTQTRKRKATNQGTSNLKKGIERCEKRRQVLSIPLATGESQYSPTRLRALMLMWCAASQKPFHAIHDPTFLSIVRILRSDAEVPSLATISTDLAHVYNQVSSSIRDKFEEMDCGIHLAISGWSSPLTASFIGIIVFWREEAKIWHSVLEFIHLTGNHTGAYMAEKTIDCLTRFRVIDKIRTVCLDHAGNNYTFVRKLAHSLPNFDGPKSRINCGTHIVDLVARSFTAIFTYPSVKQRRIASNSRVSASRIGPLTNDQHASSSSVENMSDSEDPEVILDELDGVSLPTDGDEGKELYDNGVTQKAALASTNHMKLHYGVFMSDEYTREVQSLFPKMRGFSNQLYDSNADLVAFGEIRESVKDSVPSSVELPGAVDATCWEDDLQCSESFQDLRVPIEMMISDTSRDLAKYKLTEDQWSLNAELGACMQVFLEPSLVLSQKETPIIHEVLPMFTLLKYRLERMRDNVDQLLDKHPAIRIAAQSSLITLDEYMETMAQSEVYSVATMLCPYYKLEWFVEQGYDPARIQELRQMLYRYFARVNPASAAATPAQPASTTPAPPPTSQLTSPWLRTPTRTTNTRTSHPGQDWVTTYLGSPVISKTSVDEMGGVLNYWLNEQKRGSPLGRVALDLLTAPASSVDTGRILSSSSIAASYRQHQMHLSLFRAKMAVGSWYQTPLLPEIDEVVDILNDLEGTCPEPLVL
ncbi:hypothetical protein RSOL_324140 [Rhizoctonia solani AG-3 Rhs1AP]|uniref:HAT family dimerization protein n=1 Tax=Rhizoctonia solani AG-3 Rhs1AP TaxID=1086054 RepID=A0A0A1UM63_9AGAM|nr:hypothetical protein RSOL_324140 [Rhizoctonia solani AG-3 Rhs1AP]